jgi:hypothetical protein
VIPPTIGRVVLVQKRPGSLDITQPEAAFITKVWSDRLINVGGFNANGTPFGETSVPLLQDDDPATLGPYAEWMPYQKGQAAKTEALEAKLKGDAPPPA